ncbi:MULTISPECIES: 3-isopropylmalate dehydratase [unclassified Campylobacter]|uniref:3-isopropylmalate dehydratase n=1 Tax=unclassified Campylobacter TaxID=2593542 RepID=UPI0014732339|nr:MULTISPECIES: 3-isopropylmalate dehydratase [unclassified Campylobacter]
MPEFNIAFAKLSHILPFLHTVATIVFVGFQANFWFMAKFFMKDIANNHKRYILVISALKYLGCAVYISLAVIIATSMLTGEDDYSKVADPMLNTILATKWTVFCFLLINVIYVTYRINRAVKSMKKGEYIELHENLIVVIYYFIPLNVVFALFATYLGIAYRAF